MRSWTVPLLVAGTIITGCSNSVLTKYQDNVCIDKCDTNTPQRFQQPLLQTLQMFIGEMGCFLVYFILNYSQISNVWRERLQSYQLIFNSTPKVRTYGFEEHTDDQTSPLMSPSPDNNKPASATEGPTLRQTMLLAVPSTCDICGTTLMNIGLIYTPVSVYQMTRGSLVLFVAVFSVLFLKRYVSSLEWASLFVVTSGVAVVGLSSTGSSDGDENPLVVPGILVFMGICFVTAGQLFTATQFVVEEHILSMFEMHPLKLVGWEGVFGSTLTFIAMCFLHLTVGITDKGRGGIYDMQESLRQMFSNTDVLWSSLAIMVSIGSFNFFGLSLTNRLSATSRSTIDTCRTLAVWLVSLTLGWETFKWLQMLGFVLLVYGTLVFNGVIEVPWWPWKSDRHLIDTIDEQIERL